jgi:hypothetical protein
MSVVTIGNAQQHEEPYIEVLGYDAWAGARRLRDFLSDEEPSLDGRIAIRDMLREAFVTVQEAYENNEAALAATAPAAAA